MLITAIDKATNSPCGKRCGYILPNTNIVNPINWVFVKASKVFPVDYVLALLLVMLFFTASVVGIAFLGIRFLWVSLFELRISGTKPQGLLLSTVMLTLMVLAINYSLTMVLVPQYSHFGGQKYCSDTGYPPISALSERFPIGHKCPTEYIIPCDQNGPSTICTPTVVSSFTNRITLNFPFLGDFAFWAQFAFLGMYLLVTITGMVWTPKLGDRSEEDIEEEEEEGLLAGASRRSHAAWQDLTGRYGTTSSTA